MRCEGTSVMTVPIQIYDDTFFPSEVYFSVGAISGGYVAFTYFCDDEYCATVWDWMYGFEVMVSVIRVPILNLNR